MNFLDFAIIVCAALYLAAYKRLSFMYYLVCSAGFFGGYFGGLFLAPSVVKNFHSDLRKGVISLGLMFGLAVTIGLLAMYPGRKLRMSIIQSSLFRFDKLLAWPYKFAVIFVAIILLSQSLIYVPILSLQFIAQGSSILMPVSKILTVGFLDTQARKIDPQQFRHIHLQYDPYPLTFNNIKNADTFQSVVDAAAPSVVKLSGRSCIGLGFGSGFVVAPHLVVTNAHVVDGASSLYISDHKGSYPATPVLIDQAHDIAVVYSRFITLPSLSLLSTTTDPGAESVILGYTGGGDLQMEQARVATPTFVPNAKKSKLDTTNTLSFEGIKGVAGPGNSGGPVLNHDGKVIGVLNAGRGNEFVAISSELVTDLVDQAKGKLLPAKTDLCQVFAGYY